MNVVIVDYGMGNVKSILSTLNYLNIDKVILSNSIKDFEKADKIILPGVGNFGKAINIIKNKKIDIHLRKIVIEQKKPLLGICLGMQLMSTSSTEQGFNNGLAYVKGEVIKFDNSIVKVPHVGFNQVKINKNSKLFEGISDGADFYFTHSYRLQSKENINQTICNYQGDFIAGFELDNLCGVQFHPELSQSNGLRLFTNFINNF
jgi:imidazole glycerol-phosphate synthase subunit HisH